MKIHCDRKRMEEGVLTVAKAISQRSPLPILSHLLIQTISDDQIKLAATDLELSIETVIPAQVLKPGSLAVPARIISDILTQLTDKELVMESIDEEVAGKMELRTPNSQYTIHTLAADDFPAMPRVDERPTLTLPQSVFKNMIRNVAFAAAQADESRAILTGALMDFKSEKVIMVATDGRRLAKMEERLVPPLAREERVVVPARALHELSRLLHEEGEHPVDIILSSRQISFKLDQVILITRTLEGEYPNYQQVIPSSFLQKVSINRAKLVSALKRALILAQERESPRLFNFAISSQQVVITSQTQDLGQAYEEIPITLEGEGMEIAFNGKYLLDVMGNLASEEIQLNLIGSEKPALVTDSQLEQYKYIIMPVKIKGGEEESRESRSTDKARA